MLSACAREWMRYTFLMALLDTIGLTRKITRPRLEKFLQQYATDAETLDIGCGNDQYGELFPNRTTLDIEAREGVQREAFFNPVKRTPSRAS